MIKHWTNDKGVKYLFVLVPEGIKDMTVCSTRNNGFILKFYVGKLFGGSKSIELCDKKCVIIGLSKDLTEEQLIDLGLVEEIHDDYHYGSGEGLFWVYPYDEDNEITTESATYSFKTMLESFGFKNSDNIAVLEVKG